MPRRSKRRRPPRLAVRLDAIPSLVVNTNNSVKIYATRVRNGTIPNCSDDIIEEEEANYYRLGLRQYRCEKSSSASKGSSLRHSYSQQGSVTTSVGGGTLGTNYIVLSYATAFYRRR